MGGHALRGALALSCLLWAGRLLLSQCQTKAPVTVHVGQVIHDGPAPLDEVKAAGGRSSAGRVSWSDEREADLTAQIAELKAQVSALQVGRASGIIMRV
jgi:hypothetical protein